nr:hypothetical protein Iba_chr08cCG13880 [Ipomoea batatas]
MAELIETLLFFSSQFSCIWNRMGTAFSFNSPSPPLHRLSLSFCGVLTRSAVSLLSSFVPPRHAHLSVPSAALPSPATFPVRVSFAFSVDQTSFCCTLNLVLYLIPLKPQHV